MSTVRFSQVTFATKSWVAEAWEKMVVELFSGRVVAEVKQLDEVCESKWEVELVYAPEEAESIFNRGNQAIEDIKGHVSGIRYNACKMREANRKVSELEDMHAKAIMYHNSVKPYMDTLRFHIDQLKHILHVA